MKGIEFHNSKYLTKPQLCAIMYLLRENVRNAVRRAAQERMSSFGKIDKRKCKQHNGQRALRRVSCQ